MATPECNIQLNSLAELDTAALQLIEFFKNDRVVLLDAEMGCGKTTLIKALCRALGSTDHFSSPTYALVNEYRFPAGKIFHFDLYRVKSSAELFDIGIEEYLDSDAFCFVEWPERLIEIIDTDYVVVRIQKDENIRYIRATKISA
jgi:tRNA threonylcarbamoyladenosine biosynthesis protein TsaE